MIPHKIEQHHTGGQTGSNVFIIENEFDQRLNGFFKVNENRAKRKGAPDATIMVPHCYLGARGPIEVVSRRQREPNEEKPRLGSNSSHYNPAFITPFSSLRHTRKYISGEKKLFFTPVCEARHNRLRNPSHI